MRYVVMFEDNDGKADLRTKHMQAHLAFVEAHKGQILAAGPLFDGTTAEGRGGMWLVEAESADQVQALVETDPFWPTGLRKAVHILHWKQVFRDGERVV